MKTSLANSDLMTDTYGKVFGSDWCVPAIADETGASRTLKRVSKPQVGRQEH